MDFAYLFNILLRRKWLILSVVLLSSVATWFLIGKLPPVFKAKTIITTGIIDYKGVSLQKDNPFIQKFQIESSFNGLIEKMKSRTTIQLLTNRLLLHDLILADGVNVKPFREPDPDESGLTQADIDKFALKLKTNNPPDSSLKLDKVAEHFNNKIAEAYKYDYESLMKKFEVNRIGETDYLSIEFESESPELSYFVVKTFFEEFYQLHEDDLSYKENVALKFHAEQVANRKKDLDSKIEEINMYKKQNGLVDVSYQRENVVSHLRDLETKREEHRQAIPALESSIAILNSQILKYNREGAGGFAATVFFGDDFRRLSEEIKQLQDKLIDQVANGLKNTAALEAKIEDLQRQQSELINKSPAFASKAQRERLSDQVQGWIKDQLEKQLELEFARASVRSFDEEIARLQGRASKLLTDDNHLNTLIAEQDRLQKEYLRATEELDKAKLYAEGTENPLSVIEPVEMPDEPEPSHRPVFAAFAGVASGTLTSIILFLLAFIDSSLQSPFQFQRITQLPLLGYANRVRVKNLNLQHLFSLTQSKNELEIFKENIRKLRTAIENSGAKSFLFVSPKEQEGKSFLIVLLAYALSLNGKRILIIDTNFKNNTLSNFKTKSFIEISTEPSPGGIMGNLQTNRKQLPSPSGMEDNSDPHLKNIDIVGNKGGSQSPSEVLAGKDFGKVIQHYATKYDFIFLEAAAMNTYSDARELLPFVEKVIAIFSSQVPVGSADKDTIQFLKKLDGQILGGILNNVDLKNL
jgi:Mrp family chromosome partitioning ATPase/uncharacterized protein involved in exopolysaccharide biosynthesis